MLKKAKFKKIISLVLSIVFVLSLLTMPSSANPSSWCLMHKKTGCTHCVNHTIMGVGSATANCVDPGGGIGSCITLGCGHTFYQTAPTNVHSYTNNICTILKCGKVNGGSLNYMFRGSTAPIHVASNGGGYGYRGDHMPSYPQHTGVDIGNVAGVNLYSVGTGIVTEKRPNNSSLGHYVVIELDFTHEGTKLRVGYAHMQSASSFNKDDIVNTQSIVGRVGGTGGSTTFPPHLHFVAITNGTNDAVAYTNITNPLRFFPPIPFTGDNWKTTRRVLNSNGTIDFVPA
ncbi:MAG: M23 family metallopeptidase [Oscillospiraceae bacterium]|jgi:hypothetical protein|nr:M23 family metallopeptidase [Oscillospiraceae bacterium]